MAPAPIWRGLAAIFLIAIGGWLGTARAQALQPVPPLQARVTDLTGTLDAIQRQGLEDKLAALEKTKGSQVAFLMVATVKPEDVFSYAQRVGTEWKIGRKGVGDGVLLVVAKDDRKMHLAVAKALEGAIPDIVAKQILDEALAPNFRKGDYAGGLHAAADAIIARINGEALPAPSAPSRSAGSGQGFDWTDLGILLFFAVPVGAAVLKSMVGNKLGTVLTGGLAGLAAFVLTSSVLLAALAAFAALLYALFTGALPSAGRGYRRGTGTTWGHGGGWSGGAGGWSGGGSDSGGFSSGGGGDFGGGGASGDW